MARPIIKVIRSLCITFVLLSCSPDKGKDVDRTDVSFSLASAKLSFAKDIEPILNSRCATCHSRNFYSADSGLGCTGMITFENTALGSHYYGGPLDGQSTGCPNRSLYQRLIELKSWGCYSMNYVKAGDPNSSFLLIKLIGGNCADGTQVNRPPSSITSEEIEKIKKWISDGALI